ncbi:MAG: zinc-ribbon domain-containing protein [Thermodesulfobacteriota bacterium]
MDKAFKFISKEDSCAFQMIIPRENHEIVKKVTVNMPGEIIESNIKGFSGNSLVWNRTATSGNKLFVKSKPPELFKNTILILIVIFLILGVGVFTAILVMKMRRKPKEMAKTLNFCSECGSKAGTDDLFCQNCGQRLG